MKKTADGFQQACDAQAAVGIESRVVVSSAVSYAAEKAVAEKMLGNADRVIMLANNDEAHEILHDRILPHEISRAEQRDQRTSTFVIQPASTPHSAVPIPVLACPGAADAKVSS